jgi:large subunit ribosomal protein L18
MMIDIKRRRRTGVTNYNKRIALLKSGLPRVVVRKSNRAVRLQIIEYVLTGDKVIATANSKELIEFGWRPRCNIPTAYLTGMLLARKAKKTTKGSVIPDIGLYRPVKSSVAFAAIKGCMDNGLKIPGSIEVDKAKISGKAIKDYAQKLSAAGSKRPQFARYAKENFDVSKIDETFEAVRKKIMASD